MIKLSLVEVMLFTQSHIVSKWPILDTISDLFDIRTHHLIFFISIASPLHCTITLYYLSPVHVVGDKMWVKFSQEQSRNVNAIWQSHCTFTSSQNLRKVLKDIKAVIHMQALWHYSLWKPRLYVQLHLKWEHTNKHFPGFGIPNTPVEDLR